VNIIGRREIQTAEDPAAKRQELVEDYAQRYEHPYIAASKGYVDDVIDPRDTRIKIAHALDMLRNKAETLPAKKHSNVPL
jgi:propionyl-CoA carboxylase beta chain